MELAEEVLRYLQFQGRSRQKHHIKEDLNIPDADRYLEQVLTKLRKQGLIKVVGRYGWWSITERGKAYLKKIDPGLAIATTEEYIEDEDRSLFSEEEINSDSLLRLMSIYKKESKTIASYISEDHLKVAAMLYCISKETPIPVGKKFDNEIEFNTVQTRLNEIIKIFPPQSPNS